MMKYNYSRQRCTLPFFIALFLGITLFPSLAPAGSSGWKVPARAFSASDLATPVQVTTQSIFSPSSKLSAPETLHAKINRTGEVRVIAKVDVPGYAQLQNQSASFTVAPPEFTSSPAAAHRASQALQADKALSAAIVTTADTVQRKLSAANVVFEKTFQYIPYIVLTVDADGLNKLAALPEVLAIEEDVASPLPVVFDGAPQEISAPLLDTSVSVIGADTLWSRGYTGSGWYVAVLDTGLLTSHEFFSGKNIVEACFTSKYDSYNPSARLCPDGNDEQTGTGAAAPYPSTNGGYDHGTHVAGITSGQKQDGSLKGVAPDSNVIAVQVFSDGFTSTTSVLSYTSDQIAGLEYVYSLRNTYAIASVNMSLGGGKYSSNCDTDSSSRKAAIDNLRDAGIATVIASGNSSYCDGIGSPACISTCVAVGATDDSDYRASFSNWEAELTPLFAPGVSITSSTGASDTSYGEKSGTSMAAPHVSGAWALLKQVDSYASINTLLNSLKSTAKPVDFDGLCDSPQGITRRIQVDEAASYIPDSAALPTVSTTAVSSMTASSATSGGEVTDSGDSSVFARGVCWSETSNPTILSSKTHDGRESGSFTSYLSGLNSNTTYYVRAYAINASGVGYGSELSFTTQSPPLITSFTPAIGAAGDTISISGTGLANVSQVSFGNTAAASFTVNSSTSISAVVGNGSTGVVGVNDSNGVGLSTTPFAYSGEATAPTITNFAPAAAASNNNVILHGDNFTGATAVTFGGTNASSFNVVNDSIIHATIGAGATGLISVTTPQGTALSSSQICYTGENVLRLVWKQAETGKIAYANYTGAQYNDVKVLGAGLPEDYESKAVGDFNSDGLADIIARNPNTGQTLAVFLQSGFAYSSHAFLDTQVPAPWNIVGAGDFNADNFTDLVVANSTTGDIAVMYLGSGFNVASIKKLNMSVTPQWTIVAIGDMNSDGFPDIIFQNNDGWVGVLHIASGFISSTIKRLDLIIPTEWSIVGVWDFNNDGQLDLMAQNKTEYTIAAMYLSNGFGFKGHSPINGVFQEWFTDGWEVLSPGDIF